MSVSLSSLTESEKQPLEEEGRGIFPSKSTWLTSLLSQSVKYSLKLLTVSVPSVRKASWGTEGP